MLLQILEDRTKMVRAIDQTLPIFQKGVATRD